MAASRPFYFAVSKALRQHDHLAIKRLVGQAINAQRNALIHSEPEPKEFFDLTRAAYYSFSRCRVKWAMMLLAAGLPIETLLRSTSPSSANERSTLLETVVTGYDDSDYGAQAELVDLLLSAGADRTVTGRFGQRHSRPISELVDSVEVARVFLKHGVRKRAFRWLQERLKVKL